MKLNVLDIEKFVKVNQLRQVTAPNFFEPDGSPTVTGLFSADIFGRLGSEDRRRRWAYIDLGGRFLHPLIYKTCSQLDRKFPEVVAGFRRLRLTRSGEPQEVPEEEEGGFTGIDGLYEHWSEIRWGRAESGHRAERVGLLRAIPRELAFISKWPVMPALFRDVDTTVGGAIKEVPPINYLYAQLITGAPSVISGLTFVDGGRKKRAQEGLLAIHRASLELLAGKRGLIQDRLLGKYTDYSVRSVLSGPKVASERPGDQEVPFGALGVPLHLYVNMMQPFVLKLLAEQFRPFLAGQEVFQVRKSDGSLGTIEVPADVRKVVGPELFKKWISTFLRSQENRLDVLAVPGPRGTPFRIPLYDQWLGRPTTLIDLMYVTASKIAVDKYVMFTRYPVEDFRAPHFARPVLLTTERTRTQSVGDVEYKNYPVIDNPLRWVDSLRINNSYTAAMGADYDGDTIRVIGLFTQEANEEARKLIEKPTNFCDGQGAPSRKLGNEAVLTFYALTK
jgi:hypothetical protein